MKSAALVLVALLAAAPAQAASDPGECDLSGDARVTVRDALIALHQAVENCQTTYYCDSNGDYENTATDALLLLRVAVGLPAELECSCIYVDECFGDEDCVAGYPPGYFCAAYLCVECEQDSDCDDGERCDRCRYECVPETE